MSWLYSQVLVEEYLGDISSDGEQSAPLSGKPTQQAYCSPDKMTECSRLSRSGMMFKPLTEDRGEALLMSYREAFLVRTSQLLGGGQESRESEAECGKKWHGSFVKYDLDSSLWKTHQCSLLGDLEPFSETWPRWGLMRNGECWEQQMLALHTSETESGLWPTPVALMGGMYYEDNWENRKSPSLATAVLIWPTPRTKGGRRTWGTPKAQDSRHAMTDRGKYNLGEQVAGLHGGKLNPMWVEWLMGWPLGWTDLKPLETDKFQRWLDEHGGRYELPNC
jgi:hypothetical protein